jgi:xylan 1,4-beta-xylosidase
LTPVKLLRSVLFVICLIFISNLFAQVHKDSGKLFKYKNPIKTEILRDPFIKYIGGKYYMTATCYPFSPGDGKNPGVKLWSSNDLLHWDFEKVIVRPNNKSWYQKRFWAPEIFQFKGKFYVTFNAYSELPEFPQSVGLAVSDKIDGDYKVLTEEKPLCEGNDADLFLDNDGKVYLFTSGINVQEIDLENVCLIGERKQILTPGEEHSWDGGKDVGIEGPGVIKRNDTYYLFYSSWGRGYEVGYAAARNILGPWTKCKDNPIYGAQSRARCERYNNEYKQSADIPFSEVGHGQPFYASDGSLWLSSHGLNPQTLKEPQLVIDPIFFDKEGNVKVKMTWTPQQIKLKK